MVNQEKAANPRKTRLTKKNAANTRKMLQTQEKRGKPRKRGEPKKNAANPIKMLQIQENAANPRKNQLWANIYHKFFFAIYPDLTRNFPKN